MASFRRARFPAILTLLAALFLPTIAPLKSVHAADAGAQRGKYIADAGAQRGKYIVEGVAKCVECHTPRDASGNLNANEYLRGAPIPVKAPPYKNMKWALKSPNIVGLPGYTEQDGVRLLTQGINRNGERPMPPMPQFRMTPEDARAVVAYLKSLE